MIYKVFDYYKSLGVLEVTMTSLPDSQPNHPVLTNLWMYKHNDPHLQLWRDEPIFVNDCLLRKIHKFQYIANIDNDEMIIAEESRDWNEMLEGLLGHSVSLMLTSWMICWSHHLKTSQIIST